MIDVSQLRGYVIRPVLQDLGMHSEAAENLLLGTAAQESRLGAYLHQRDDGPALGIYQMEPATHEDIWNNYLLHRPVLAHKANAFIAPSRDKTRELIGNLNYATAMCRLHYYRVAAPLPKADDIVGLAAYWKKYYNTEGGKGSVSEFIAHYRSLVGGT
jgi:hypothetical protein